MLAAGFFSPSNYWITWFPGSLVAAWAFVKLAYKGIIAFDNIIKAAKRVDYEFSPNGGKSMRDQVDKLSGTMTTHIESDRRAFARQDRFNGKIERSLDRIEDHLKA